MEINTASRVKIFVVIILDGTPPSQSYFTDSDAEILKIHLKNGEFRQSDSKAIGNPRLKWKANLRETCPINLMKIDCHSLWKHEGQDDGSEWSISPMIL